MEPVIWLLMIAGIAVWILLTARSRSPSPSPSSADPLRKADPPPDPLPPEPVEMPQAGEPPPHRPPARQPRSRPRPERRREVVAVAQPVPASPVIRSSPPPPTEIASAPAATVPPAPVPRRPEQTPAPDLLALLQSQNGARAAIIMQEVLGPPRCRRQR